MNDLTLSASIVTILERTRALDVEECAVMTGSDYFSFRLRVALGERKGIVRIDTDSLDLPEGLCNRLWATSGLSPQEWADFTKALMPGQSFTPDNSALFERVTSLGMGFLNNYGDPKHWVSRVAALLSNSLLEDIEPTYARRSPDLWAICPIDSTTRLMVVTNE